jgi:quinol monooxygenase YgiN
MAVFSIWESWFPPEHHTAGREVTEAIWRDMQAYGGYLRHVIVEDLDDPGHLIVVSEWQSRAAADATLAEYAEHQNAKRANALVAQPRRRTLGRAIASASV